jgi:hypothetical protein
VHKQTKNTQWTKPAGFDNDTQEWQSFVDPSSGKTFYRHKNGTTQWTKPAGMN